MKTVAKKVISEFPLNSGLIIPHLTNIKGIESSVSQKTFCDFHE